MTSLYAVRYGSGRESCKDKAFCPGPGVLPGTFSTLYTGGPDTTLSELGQTGMLFKVGTLSYNWSTIGLQSKHLHSKFFFCTQQKSVDTDAKK